MSKFRDYFKRKAMLPTGSKFITSAKITKHRQVNNSEPVLMMTIEVDGEIMKFAIHQGLAWQMVRQIRKSIGFSESELEAAQWLGRYTAGD